MLVRMRIIAWGDTRRKLCAERCASMAAKSCICVREVIIFTSSGHLKCRHIQSRSYTRLSYIAVPVSRKREGTGRMGRFGGTASARGAVSRRRKSKSEGREEGRGR